MTPFYDPLLAKLCVHGADRAAALELARAAVAAFEIEGLKTNLPFFTELLANEEFIAGVLRHRLDRPDASAQGRPVCLAS